MASHGRVAELFRDNRDARKGLDSAHFDVPNDRASYIENNIDIAWVGRL